MTPMIRAKKKYYSVENLFNYCKIDNGKCVATFRNDEFTFKVSGEDTLKIESFVSGEENIEVGVLFSIDSSCAKIIENVGYNEIILDSFTIKVDKSVNVNYGEKIIGKKINVDRLYDKIYLEGVIDNLNKSFVFSLTNKTTKNDCKYAYMNMCITHITRNFNFEISTENELAFFRKFGEKGSIKQSIYKAFYGKDLYFFLCNIIKFNGDVLYKVWIEPKDFASILELINLYLLAFKYHGLTAKEEVSFLVKKAEKTLFNATVNEVDLSLDFLEKIDESSSDYRRICDSFKKLLIGYVSKVRVDVLFSKLIATGDLAIILLFAKHKKMIAKEYYQKFLEYVNGVDFYNDKRKSNKYYECLYYLYDEENKNLVYDAINDEEIDIAKIALVTDKIMGFDLVKGLISFRPSLPYRMEKSAMNIAIGDKTVSCIAKRGYDYFEVNKKVYEESRKVLLKGKTVKIVSSSR